MSAIEWPEDHDNEEHLVSDIKEKLLTEDQRLWLFNHRLDVADLLNGRYGSVEEPGVAAIYEAWNAKLGKKEFGQW